MDEKLNLTDEGACETIADKIKKIRGGNRLMAAHDVNTTVHFYRRDEPEKKCGTLKLNGVFDFSLLDAGIALGAVILLMNILGAIASFIRRIK